MIITLKKVKINDRASEETTHFTADIYADGKLVGYAKNDGHGGSTDYYPVDGKRAALTQLEIGCQNQPGIVYQYEGKPYTMRPSLENTVDEIISKKVDENAAKKSQQQLNRSMLKGILYLIEGDPQPWVTSWKGKTLAKMLETVKGQSIVLKKIEEIKAAGHKILNTNLNV